MRSRLQLPSTNRLSGRQTSFQAKHFGELRFRPAWQQAEKPKHRSQSAPPQAQLKALL